MKPADSKRFEFSDFSSIVLEFAHLYYITLKSICSFVPGLFKNQPGLTKALVFVFDLVFVLEHEQAIWDCTCSLCTLEAALSEGWSWIGRGLQRPPPHR